MEGKVSAGTVYIWVDNGFRIYAVSITPEATGPTPATVSIAETTLTTGVGIPKTIEATVGGNPTPTIQWYQCDDANKTNATAIDGATAATYEYTPSAAGTYYFYCTATNEIDGTEKTAISNVVTINVESSITITSTVNLDGSGTVKMTPASGIVTEGQTIEMTATPNTGYKFLNWTDATNAVLSTDNPYTFTPTADATITANFEKLTAVKFEMGDAENGIAPNTLYGNTGESVEIPANVFMYSSGKTLKGWTDGTSTYNAGQTLTIGTSDVTLTPVLEDNTTSLASTKEDVTVTWSFDPNNGAPTFDYQNGQNWNDIKGNAYYVVPTIVNGTSIDVAMQFETRSSKTGLSGNGKISNIGRTSNTQINKNTVFTVPVTKGCVIEMKVANNYKITATTINGTTDYTAGQTIQYTYTGTDETTQIVIVDGSYYEYIKVTYPGTKCATPIYTTGNFNFERHAASVTFTAKEGQKLMVSVDDAEATMMDSPATVYPATQATAYATADGMENSDIATAVISNEYDAAKPYVAWVYTSTYPAVKDGFADDKILNGLKENYNVVLIDYPETATPSDDLNNADLIVCTESMAGNRTMSNGMKKFVGVTPMINLKMFNYTSGRWGWGTPNNPGKDIIGFTPTSKYYKVLDGVTFEADGNVNFYTIAGAATDNHIQTNKLETAPEGNVIMGTVAINGEAAMHCMDKFFGLGLSSNTWKEYNDNAAIVIKNAAAMLLAGEALDTEVYPDYTLTTTDADFYTLYLGYDATIPAGVEVYSSVLNADNTLLTVNKVDGNVLPANTAVLLKSPAGAGEFTFEHATEAAATVETALLGVTETTPYTELTPEGKTLLTLGTKDGVVAFRMPYNAEGSLKANRAYLLLDKTTSEAKSIRVVFGGGDPTGIREIHAAETEADTPIYNMAGQRVAAGTKGLLIKNGKKYINK